MGLKVWRLEWVVASSPSWGVAVCRSCLWGIWTFKTLSRVNLSSVVDWQSHVPSTHSVPWLFGVPEDRFLGRKNYKVGQSCWLCPSRLVGATLWSLCQGSIWFGAVGGGISPERKCFFFAVGWWLYRLLMFWNTMPQFETGVCCYHETQYPVLQYQGDGDGKPFSGAVQWSTGEG